MYRLNVRRDLCACVCFFHSLILRLKNFLLYLHFDLVSERESEKKRRIKRTDCSCCFFRSHFVCGCWFDYIDSIAILTVEFHCVSLLPIYCLPPKNPKLISNERWDQEFKNKQQHTHIESRLLFNIVQSNIIFILSFFEIVSNFLFLGVKFKFICREIPPFIFSNFTWLFLIC